MGKFDKYEQIVEGKTKIILKDDDGNAEDEFELVVRNSEKMLIMNYFTVQNQATRRLEFVDPRLTDRIEALYVQLFRRAYPKENAASIQKMVSERFMDIMSALMIGFKWTTEEAMEKAKEEYMESMTGKKKPGGTPQKS